MAKKPKPLKFTLALGAILGALIIPSAVGAAGESTALTTAKQSLASTETSLTNDIQAEEAAHRGRVADEATKTKLKALVTELEGTPPPKEEPPVTGEHVVSSSPLGVPVPASGWHVAYADAFGSKLGSGTSEDGTWSSGEKWNGCCTNSNEVAVEQHSDARVGPEGLELVCLLGTFTVEGVTRKASCGSVRTDLGNTPHPFEYAGNLVGEFAVEVNAKWPVCAGGADPGFWIYPGSSTEIDFFEGWCWPTSSRAATSWASAEAGIPVMVSQGRHEIFPVTTGLGFDPSTAYHRYTTAFVPEGSGKYDVREYIDGVFRWNVTGQTLTSTYDGLNLTNGLRVNVQADNFLIRSVSMWQDGAHAGQGIKGGGVVPGTTVK